MAGAPIVDAAKHRGAALAIAAGVLLVHAWLLGTVPIAWPGAAHEAPRAGALQTRRIAALPPPPHPAETASPEPRARPAVRAVATAARRAMHAPEATLPSARAAAPAPAAASAPEPVAVAPAPEPSASGDIPIYRTAPPPAATLRYEMRRGRLAGGGVLRWRPDGERYTATLEGRVAGISVLTQVSSGTLGPAGLEPDRFTDRRLRRGEQAANFGHDTGRVTFSGPSAVLDWHSAMQDRLSWMLQLAAVTAAEPQRLAEGATVSLRVVGARGDAGVWVFRSTGAHVLETGAGPLETVRFVREPRALYDTSVEVWLATAHQNLPVRAVLGNGTEDSGLEILLQDFAPP